MKMWDVNIEAFLGVSGVEQVCAVVVFMSTWVRYLRYEAAHGSIPPFFALNFGSENCL